MPGGMHPCKLSGTGRAACKSTGKMCGAVFLYGIRVFLLLSKLQCLKRILSKILHIMKLFAVSVVFYFIWECFMKAWNGERVWTWIKGLVSTEHLKEFFVYNSTSPVRAHLWFLPALIYCYLLALLIEKWRMRRAAYCMAPVLLAILLWRAEFCVFLTDFITLWNTETFCLQE